MSDPPGARGTAARGGRLRTDAFRCAPFPAPLDAVRVDSVRPDAVPLDTVQPAAGRRTGCGAIGIGHPPPGPHPPAVSLVGPYVYSYDVAAVHRQPTTSRSIPGMRPSYDAEHPSSATPIYDSLYSEYRRLFRALPGDRTGEEDLRFTGFAVRDASAARDTYGVRETYAPRAVEPAGYPPQHQAFHTYAGHAQGTPQFMPTQQATGGQFSGAQFNSAQQHTGGQPSNGPFIGGQMSGNQFSGGHGWVATGYLAAPPAPQATATTAPGRHRSNLLSLPPGRVPGQG